MAKKQVEQPVVEEMSVAEVMSVYEEQGEPVVKWPDIGSIVHYVSALKRHRAAIVTNVLDAANGVVNLCVFYDGELDGYAKDCCPQWLEVVTFDPSGETTDTWHWMEKA